MFAIPNGGNRNIVTATKLKKEGVLAGVADLFLMQPRRSLHGLFIEMKPEKGKATASQLDFGRQALKRDYGYVIAYGVDDAREIITEYLK